MNIHNVTNINSVKINYDLKNLSNTYASLVWAQNSNSVKRYQYHRKISLIIIVFQSGNSNTGPLFKVSKLLGFLLKQLLNIAFSKIFKKGCCFQCSATGSNFILSHIFMILDGQILVILEYPFIALKLMVDLQCL